LDFKKYGFSENDPDYYLNTSRAIWDDGGLTFEDKIEVMGPLIKSYMSKKEKEKKIATGQDKGNDENIKNLLGLSQSASEEDVKKELTRLKPKSKATWKALKLHKIGKTKEEILTEYGV